MRSPFRASALGIRSFGVSALGDLCLKVRLSSLLQSEDLGMRGLGFRGFGSVGTYRE